mgnify:FL=1
MVILQEAVQSSRVDESLGRRAKSDSFGNSFARCSAGDTANSIQKRKEQISALTAFLDLRFGDEHLTKVFEAQVKTSIQKAEEPLQESEADVKKLVRVAYSDTPLPFQGRFATETFVSCIRDGEVKKILQVSTYQTSFDALIRVL